MKFEKPDLACRSQIWQAMIPSLEDADASFLAARYDFSGGEIENIARHYTIQTICMVARRRWSSLLPSLREREVGRY